MCNAWNHHPGCTCGWGGIGHLGRRGNESSSFDLYGSKYWWVPSIQRTLESYVNPNALCPVCGEKVFFYQSPDGGRVFFDELGPPWPKHPCTDNAKEPRKDIGFQFNKEQIIEDKEYQWQKNEWTPYFIDIVTIHQGSILEIIGRKNNKQLVLYMSVVEKQRGYDEESIRKCIAYIKEAKEKPKSGYPIVALYELAILTVYGANYTLKVSNSLDAINNQEKVKNKSNAMSLAFENALKKR